MEIIRKPEETATEIISIRVTTGLKKEHTKARVSAQRQGIDMTAMVTKALSDVFKNIEQAGSIQGSKRIQNENFANGKDS